MPRFPLALVLGPVTALAAGCATPVTRSRPHPLPPRPENISFFADDAQDSARRRFDPVIFHPGSWHLGDQELPALARIASGLGGDSTVIVAGVGDPGRPDEFNRVLGEARAQSVRLALIDAGIALARLQTVSFGGEWPEGADANVRSSVVVRLAE